MKPNFKVREITAKKLKHAKELVAKAKAVVKRAAASAERSQKKVKAEKESAAKKKKREMKKLKKVKTKSVVDAARQQTIATKLKRTQDAERGIKRKKQLTVEKLKKATLVVKELEGKKLGKFRKQERKLEKKMRVKEKMKEKNMRGKEKIKEKKMRGHIKRKERKMRRYEATHESKVDKKLQRAKKKMKKQIKKKLDAKKKKMKKKMDATIDDKLSRMDSKLKKKFKKGSVKINHEKQKLDKKERLLKKKALLAGKEIQKKKDLINKKLGMVKRLEQADAAVMDLRKKVVSAQLKLKFALNPGKLKLEQENVNKKLKSKRAALLRAKHKKRHYEKQKKKREAALHAAKKEKAKKATAKVSQMKLVSKLKGKAHEQKTKRKVAQEKQSEEKGKAERRAKHSERVEKIAAAKTSDTLQALYAKLSSRQRILQHDVWRLKLGHHLTKMNKVNLVKFYTSLGEKEVKLRSRVKLDSTVLKTNQEINTKYRAQVNKINKSDDEVWLKVTHDNFTGKAVRLQEEILSEKQFSKTLRQITALHSVNSAAALLKKLDAAKNHAMIQIAKLKARVGSTRQRRALYQRLKHEAKALKADSLGTSAAKKITRKLGRLRSKIITAQVKKAKKVERAVMKHSGKLAKAKEFIQKDAINNADANALKKKLKWQDKRIQSLQNAIKKLHSRMPTSTSISIS